MSTRRQFLASSLALSTPLVAAPARRPNILLIVTDDQGYADVGVHGNPDVQTPHLDGLAKQSVQFSNFCVSPVCAPTRASSLTGRDYYRTGVTETYKGRAIMDPREVTLAEMLRGVGYRNGIFGKWHLGDNHPCRPIDKGFHEELVHLGGGLAQPSATREDGGYFDPRLRRNGKFEKTRGYCTDIFADAAIDFIHRHREQPFFAYLATNAPHDPYIVPAQYSAPYKAKGIPEKESNIYGMITNLDDNVGRVLSRLEELRLADNTIVLFMTDNGPTNRRYSAGLRDQKASVYEGGIRSPLFVRWPQRWKAARVDRMSAATDVTPTLLQACGVSAPKQVKFDGRSLLPLLERKETKSPERTIFIQVHRGDAPDLYRNFCARTQRWKLLHPVPLGKPMTGEVKLELYDLQNDPGEKENVIAQHSEIASRLKSAYEAWFRDVTTTRGFAPVRIRVGTPFERVTELTRQEWRGPYAEWNERLGRGYWELDVAHAGPFDVEMRFPPFVSKATAGLRVGSLSAVTEVAAGEGKCTFSGLRFPLGPLRLEPLLTAGTEVRGAHFVDVRWLG